MVRLGGVRDAADADASRPLGSVEWCLEALRWAACFYVTRGMAKKQALLKAGVIPFHASNSSQAYLFQSAAKAYIEATVLDRFMKVCRGCCGCV